MPLKAGTAQDIYLNSGTWIIVDIGFAGDRKRSCGLSIGNEEPVELTFSECCERISQNILESSGPINLLVEAPLSVAFSQSGNPTGRAMEKRGSQTRYWYVGLGCAVLVASQFLISRILKSCESKDVRLFEGFVSFKPANELSSHKADVERLRQVVSFPHSNQHKILSPDTLKQNASDLLETPFHRLPYEIGSPPVIMG